jgi:hypothetical protein
MLWGHKKSKAVQKNQTFSPKSWFIVQTFPTPREPKRTKKKGKHSKKHNGVGEDWYEIQKEKKKQPRSS